MIADFVSSEKIPNATKLVIGILTIDIFIPFNIKVL
jgi:hypothetical protein